MGSDLDEMRLSRHPEVAQHEAARAAYLGLMHAEAPGAELLRLRASSSGLETAAKIQRCLSSSCAAPSMAVRFPATSPAPPWRGVHSGSELPDATPTTLNVQM